MKNRGWRSIFIITIVLMLSLGSIAQAGAIPADTGVDDQFAARVFVHYPWDKVPDGVPASGPMSSFDTQPSYVCGDPANCPDYGYGGTHWPDSVVQSTDGVTFYVNLSGSGDDGRFLAAVEAGAQAWEDEPGSYMNFTSQGSANVENSSLRNRMDGINAVTWERLSRYTNAIAITWTWYNTTTLEIVEVDMAFNRSGGFKWASNPGVDPDSQTGTTSAYDVQNIATHEFGHWLLLEDIYEPNQQNLTMYGYGAKGELKKRTLELGDELGIQAIYPAGAPNTPPVADANGPYAGTEDIAISFDGSGSSDADDDPLAYSWNFGDGATGTGVTPSHTYLSGGIFTVSLTVSDGRGGTDTATTIATVTDVDDQPVADPGEPYSGTVGVPVAFDGSGSYDADGDTLTYSWNFGDGATGTGDTPAHTYVTADNYTVTLTVSAGGLSDTATTNAAIIVAPVELLVDEIAPDSVDAGQRIDVTITGSGFQTGASVSLEGGSGPTPSVSNVVVQGPSTITATISAKSGGPRRVRLWDVRVTNPDSGTHVLEDGFSVNP